MQTFDQIAIYAYLPRVPFIHESIYPRNCTTERDDAAVH